jgi:hypothetical protein
MKYLVVFLIIAALPLNSPAFSQVLDSLYLPSLEGQPGDTVKASVFLANHSIPVGGFELLISLSDTSLAKFGSINRGEDIEYFSYFNHLITDAGSLIIMGIASLPPDHNDPLENDLHEIVKFDIIIDDSLATPAEVELIFHTNDQMMNIITDATGYQLVRPILVNGALVINSPNSVPEPGQVPEAFELFDNYPNPFNSHTVIEFTIAAAGQASLTIYDIQGRVVRNLLNSYYETGHYQAVWDGYSESGQAVSSGVYFYTLKSNNYLSTKKMSYLK